MSYSKTPAISTYETKRVNFFQNATPRTVTGDRDFKLINMMIETVPNNAGQTPDVRLKSRPSLIDVTLVNIYQTIGEPKGIYEFTSTYGAGSSVFFVVDDKVYYNYHSTPLITLSYTPSGPVGWAEFLTSTGQRKLILVDGIDGYVISDTGGDVYTAAKITDVDFPSPHLPFPIFLDGYLFLAKQGTNDIYNSNLDHPELWTAGDYISAEMYADHLVALAKNNNYLYALGTNSVEFFFDNANTTGSPLARQASAVQQMGCAAANSVVQTEKQVVFVGTTGNGGFTVWLIDAFTPKEIGTSSIKEAFLRESWLGSMTSIIGNVVRVNNQKLYIVRLLFTERTFVYSFDTDMWHEWQSGHNLTGTDVVRNFDGVFCSDGNWGSPYVQLVDGTILSLMDDGVINDDSLGNYPNELFLCTIQTQRLNFDTINRKTMSRLSVLADDGGNGNVPLEMLVQWSDDDGVSWNTGQTLHITPSSGDDLPAIHQLGMFRRRTFKLTCVHTATPLRLLGIEVDINKGIR